MRLFSFILLGLALLPGSLRSQIRVRQLEPDLLLRELYGASRSAPRQPYYWRPTDMEVREVYMDASFEVQLDTVVSWNYANGTEVAVVLFDAREQGFGALQHPRMIGYGRLERNTAEGENAFWELTHFNRNIYEQLPTEHSLQRVSVAFAGPNPVIIIEEFMYHPQTSRDVLRFLDAEVPESQLLEMPLRDYDTEADEHSPDISREWSFVPRPAKRHSYPDISCRIKYARPAAKGEERPERELWRFMPAEGVYVRFTQ